MADSVFSADAIKSLGLEALRQTGVVGLLLAFFMYVQWQLFSYALQTAVPAHLHQIQAGYESMQAQHMRELERFATVLDKQSAALEKHSFVLSEMVSELRGRPREKVAHE